MKRIFRAQGSGGGVVLPTRYSNQSSNSLLSSLEEGKDFVEKETPRPKFAVKKDEKKVLHRNLENRRLRGFRRYLNLDWWTAKAREHIYLTPQINPRIAVRLCGFAITLFTGLCLVLTLSVQKWSTVQSSAEFVFTAMSATVFTTFAFIYSVLAIFAINPAQRSSSILGLTVALLAGASHVLHTLQIEPVAVTSFGREVSLVQYAEWLCCVPLLAVALGHVFRLRARLVLALGATQLAMLACGGLAAVCPSRAGTVVLVCLGNACMAPLLWACFLYSYRLNAQISQKHAMKLRLLGTSVLVLWTLFPVVYLVGLNQGLSKQREHELMLLVDLLSKAAFLCVLILLHFQSTAAEALTRVVDLEQANSLQKVFLRFIFHEVRVPFHSVQLGLEHLLSEPGLEAHRPLLGTLLGAAGMMDRVINDVLSLSRLEDGRLSLEPAPFSPAKLVGATVASLHSMSQEKGLQVHTKVSARLPPMLEGDATRLAQVLANLLSNAIKFTPRGRAVTVALRATDLPPLGAPPGPFVTLRLSVKDQGIGISAEDQRRLFQPYSQIDAGKNQAGQGSGLGLSIVKHLVELHGAAIRVQSAPGAGAEFLVEDLRLPVCRADVDEVSLGETTQGLLYDTLMSQNVHSNGGGGGGGERRGQDPNREEGHDELSLGTSVEHPTTQSPTAPRQRGPRRRWEEEEEGGKEEEEEEEEEEGGPREEAAYEEHKNEVGHHLPQPKASQVPPGSAPVFCNPAAAGPRSGRRGEFGSKKKQTRDEDDDDNQTTAEGGTELQENRELQMRKRKLLIVDGDPIALKVAQKVFGEKVYLRVRAAATAAEALALHAQDPAEVAVVDFRLPDGLGPELVARLTGGDQAGGTTVVGGEGEGEEGALATTFDVGTAREAHRRRESRWRKGGGGGGHGGGGGGGRLLATPLVLGLVHSSDEDECCTPGVRGPGPKERFRAAGAADTLHKPCAKAQLQAAVAKFCAMLEAQDKANEAVEDELLDDSREEDLLQTC